MSLIDRIGTFRGNIVDSGVSRSSGNFPQFVCQLVAEEYWDDEEQVWVDWSEYDVNEITAYAILYGKGKKETLNFNQIKKALDWDGSSLIALGGTDYTKTKIQFRIAENTYENKTRLQVEWLAEYDAIPGRSVRKLNVDELKSLDAEYRQVLKASGKKVAPAKASVVTKKGSKPTSPAGPVKNKGKQTATEVTAPQMPADEPTTALPAGMTACSKKQAFDAICETRDTSDPNIDGKIAKSWQAAIREIGGGEPAETLTDEQWYLVKEKVQSETAKF